MLLGVASDTDGIVASDTDGITITVRAGGEEADATATSIALMAEAAADRAIDRALLREIPIVMGAMFAFTAIGVTLILATIRGWA